MARKHNKTPKKTTHTIQQNENTIDIMDELNDMKKRIAVMEKEIIQLKSKQAISERISERLKYELDKANQYTRRSCVILNDVPVARNEKQHVTEQKVKNIMGEAGISKDIINDIDKLHHLGKNWQNKQKVIIKFRSHSKRYAFYAKRRSLPNYRVSPALTRRRSQLLSKAREMVKGIGVVNFVYADINGDIKVRFNDPDRQGRFAFSFSSLDDLACLIHGRDFDRFISDDEPGYSSAANEGRPSNSSDDES